MQSETANFVPCATRWRTRPNNIVSRPTGAATWWTRFLFWPIHCIAWKHDIIHKTGST